MGNTTARIKKAGINFEVLVDMDNALKLRKGEIASIMPESDFIFTDMKKGEKASDSDLSKGFGTTDINAVTQMIVKSGEVQTTQAHRDAEQEKKFKQIVDFLVTNAMDPRTGNPYTPERIKTALDESRVNIRNAPVETQIPGILEELTKLLPIKLETKKIKIRIPAMHTGQAYGVISQYKDTENWLDNGDLEVIVNVPSGMVMDFYDKLNSITHGSALTEEVRE